MRPLDLIWIILPDRLLPLVLVGLGMATLIGAIRPRRALALMLVIALLPLLSVLIENAIAALPWWVGPLLLIVLGLNVCRLVLEMLFGRVAAGHILGSAVLGTVRGLAWLVSALAGLGASLVTRGARRVVRAAGSSFFRNGDSSEASTS